MSGPQEIKLNAFFISKELREEFEKYEFSSNGWHVHALESWLRQGGVIVITKILDEYYEYQEKNRK